MNNDFRVNDININICAIEIKQEAKQKLRLTNIALSDGRLATGSVIPGRTMRSGDVDQPSLRRVVDLLIRENEVRSERFQVFGTEFFDESDLSQVGLGQSRRLPACQQRTGSVVLDISEVGNRPQAVTPRRENASVTPGTTSDYFRFAAAMVENCGEGPD